ncbi:hypothetical protein PoB_002576600 [Plakobranchus ocellatus]|uniref:Uncharacterized protein n=1 Tax=Plakobranchus ocellatus TaxID=259542 RepID=A0AAV3ZJH9_9GAST|nr:hypothetical protein PoB_002576600 [Plakobranchus ocellatus]
MRRTQYKCTESSSGSNTPHTVQVYGIQEWFQYAAHSTSVRNPGVVPILGTQYKCEGSRRNSDTRYTLTMACKSIENKEKWKHSGPFMPA